MESYDWYATWTSINIMVKACYIIFGVCMLCPLVLMFIATCEPRRKYPRRNKSRRNKSKRNKSKENDQ